MSDEKQLPPCDAEVFEKGESIGLFPGIKKEDVERLCKGLSAVTGWRIDWSYFAGRPHIRALPPAEQHQGEPVGTLLIEEYFDNREVGEVDVQLDAKVCEQLAEKFPGQSFPLYTHADPNVRWKTVADEQMKVIEGLRAQLAERDALLNYIDCQLTNLQPHIEQACYPGRSGFIDNYVDPVIERIRTLSASAEPSVASEHCESEEIGRVIYAGPDSKTVTIRCKLCGHYTLEHGHVIERRLRCVECGNKAFFILLPSEKPDPEHKASAPIAWHVGGNGYDRICFEKPTDIPGQPCIQPIHDQRQLIELLKRYDLRNEEAGAPIELDNLTDLATWKRRAIEAESKLRTYDPQVVEFGERAMQALLANPKPSELVLTKCRLCDQLQVDLTARDEQIDALRQGMKGDYDLDAWLAFVEEAPQLRLDAGRYRWLRSRDLESISQGGVFAGMTPDNLVLNEETLDQAIDAAMRKPKCRHCGDTGQIMVGRSGQAEDGNAPIMEPCEDCDRGMPDLASRPEERGTPESEPCSGCGTPGWTGACNKCVPY